MDSAFRGPFRLCRMPVGLTLPSPTHDTSERRSPKLKREYLYGKHQRRLTVKEDRRTQVEGYEGLPTPTHSCRDGYKTRGLARFSESIHLPPETTLRVFTLLTLL